MLVNESPLGLERVSVGRLALKCISDVIWQEPLAGASLTTYSSTLELR
jgi:hypothetical protein